MAVILQGQNKQIWQVYGQKLRVISLETQHILTMENHFC